MRISEDGIEYAMRRTGARRGIAESVVMFIASKYSQGWSTDTTVAHLSTWLGATNPAAQTTFVQTIRGHIDFE